MARLKDPAAQAARDAQGDYLRRLRVVSRFSQAALAERCGLIRETVYKIEAGELAIDSALDLFAETLPGFSARECKLLGLRAAIATLEAG